MKIKSDFVTNSSSTAFIMCIPDWLELPLEDERFKEVCDSYSEENPIKENIEDAKILLEKLKGGGVSYLDDETNTEAFYIIREYMGSTEYCFWSVSTQGCDSIESIKPEKIDTVFYNIHKDLIKETSEFLEKEKND